MNIDKTVVPKQTSPYTITNSRVSPYSASASNVKRHYYNQLMKTRDRENRTRQDLEKKQAEKAYSLGIAQIYLADKTNEYLKLTQLLDRLSRQLSVIERELDSLNPSSLEDLQREKEFVTDQIAKQKECNVKLRQDNRNRIKNLKRYINNGALIYKTRLEAAFQKTSAQTNLKITEIREELTKQRALSEQFKKEEQFLREEILKYKAEYKKTNDVLASKYSEVKNYKNLCSFMLYSPHNNCVPKSSKTNSPTLSDEVPSSTTKPAGSL